MLPCNMKAQSLPLVVAGGDVKNDSVCDLMVFPGNGPVVLIHGSTNDTTTFYLERWNPDMSLRWSTEFHKSFFEEVPLSMAWNPTTSRLLALGYANPTQNIWGGVVNSIDGTLIGTTELWSDFTFDQEGLCARPVAREVSGFYVFSALDDSFSVYSLDDNGALLGISGVGIPDVFSDPAGALIDIYDDAPYYALTGMYTAIDQPYVSLFWNSDLLYFFDVFNPGIRPSAITNNSELNTVVAGNAVDSSAISLAIFDTIGGFHLKMDSTFDSPGYNILCTDIKISNTDKIFVLTKHFTAIDTFHILSLYDTAFNLLSETFVMPGAGDINLSELDINNIYPDYYAVAGAIKTNNPAYNDQYLIMATSTFGVPGQCVYDCVWPGDADNNGVVDIDDLLPIGAGFGYTGEARVDPSSEWYANLADDWVNTIGTINAKFANTDGNTTINRADTVYIKSNYLKGHPIYAFRESEDGEIPIWLNTAGITLTPGYNEIPIMLGSFDVQAEEIYGLTFHIACSGVTEAIVDSIDVQVKFDDSFLGTTDNLVGINHPYDTPDFGIDAGVVGIDHINKSGYGQIGRLSFVVEDNIAGILVGSGDSTLYFFISDVIGTTAEMSEVSIYGNVFPVMVNGINNQLEPRPLDVFPNPVIGNEIFIKGLPPGPNDFGYDILNTSGQVVATGMVIQNEIINNTLLQLAQGFYTLKLTGSYGVFYSTIIID